MLKIKLTLLLFAVQFFFIFYVQNYIRKLRDNALHDPVRPLKINAFESSKIAEPLQDSNYSSLYKNLGKGDPGILDVLHSRSVKVSELCKSVNVRYKIAKKNAWKPIQHKWFKKSFPSLLIIPDNKLIWCLVPKVASTSISNALIQANNLTNFIKDQKQPQLFLQRFYRNSYQILLNKTSSFTSFYITRHPFERLVSAYRNKFENSSLHDWKYFNKVYGTHILSRHRNKALLEKDLDLLNNPHRKEPTFMEFVKFLLNTMVGSYDHHWKPISSLCEVCSFRYDYQLRYDNFEVEFDVFQNHLKKEKMLPENFATKWHNRGVLDQGQRDITKTYMKKLPKTYVVALYKRFKPDFDYFGYDAIDYF